LARLCLTSFEAQTSSRRRSLFAVGRSLTSAVWILRDLCEMDTVSCSDGELWSDKVLFHECYMYLCLTSPTATSSQVIPFFCYQTPSGRCLDHAFRLTSGDRSRRLLETAVLTVSIFCTLTLEDPASVPMLSFWWLGLHFSFAFRHLPFLDSASYIDFTCISWSYHAHPMP
jgi:hypothetical protein